MVRAEQIMVFTSETIEPVWKAPLVRWQEAQGWLSWQDMQREVGAYIVDTGTSPVGSVSLADL
jgi:hypothetical protein